MVKRRQYRIQGLTPDGTLKQGFGYWRKGDDENQVMARVIDSFRLSNPTVDYAIGEWQDVWDWRKNL